MTGGIGYAVASTATAEGTTGDLTVQPSISKYVKKVPGGDGDQYELHLTASGDRVAAAPADIVIVADKSLSMKDDGRDTNSKKAVKELAEKLLTEQNKGLPGNQQTLMAVVTFSTNAQLQQGFTTDAQEITSAMTQPPDGGTNWEAALAQANKLSSGRQGVKKYIIFLSDGDPTYRITSRSACFSSYDWHIQSDYSTEESCTAAGDGHWDQQYGYQWYPYQWLTDPDDTVSGVHGQGDDDKYGFNYEAAVTEANERGDAALYVVKTSADAKKMSDFANDAHAETGKEYDGTDAKNLTDAFNAIYTSITSTATVNVFSISDTLSKWVDPVDFAGVSSGSDIDITKYVTARNGGAKLTGYRAVYNVDSRTVTVTFNEKNGITAGKSDHIDIFFKIKPSDAAYSDYATKRTYPNVGEAGTGQTSADQQGYYSNDDAQMSYCALLNVNGTRTCGSTQTVKTIKYRHPVVQVQLGSIDITKRWSDGPDKHAKDPVTVQLQRSAGGKAENVGVPITLNTGNEWKAHVDGLLPGYTYTVVETSKNNRYGVTYQYGNGSSTTGVKLTKQMVWDDAGTLSATITNTLETASLSKEAIKVKKVIDGRDWRDSDKFKFTLTPDEKGNPMPVECAEQNPCTVTVGNGSDHTGTFGDITYEAGTQQYHYTVTEQAGTAPAMHYSQARYEIVVSVTKTQDGTWVANVSTITKVSDDNGGTDNEDIASDQPMTFTNKYTAVASLPLTGGATARTWLLTSGSLGVLALLLLVGLAVRKSGASLI
ncbi:VWA domain-containing protein [Bifidobacterium thermacidophilum]|uniref:VWA domain-containing protein n=1 Tax=Bifidobacterium thermacidophilum TaxID=246618 RepID=A0ABW8KQQ6_9BIFI